jgi:hypothetical protein
LSPYFWRPHKEDVYELEKENAFLKERISGSGDRERTMDFDGLPTQGDASPPPLLDDMDKRTEVKELLDNLKKALPALATLLEECSDSWIYEDGIYRFYHQSWKVYNDLQFSTLEIVKKLQEMAPERPLNEWFITIVRQGTGKTWKREDNENWLVL